MKTEPRHPLPLALLLALLLATTGLEAKDGRLGKWKGQIKEQKTETDGTPANDESRQQKTGTTKTQLEVKVVDEQGEPIEGARVMVVFSDKGETERSTNRRGVARLSGLPQGHVDVDVTAPGRLSASRRTTLDKARMSLRFTLKRRTPAGGKDKHDKTTRERSL